MNALIPGFIQEEIDRGRDQGEFSAVCMSLDLSGFTVMTEDLMEQGKGGAEELSRVINDLFGTIVAIIGSYRGTITSFAGDALTALFPSDDPSYGATGALRARDAIRERRRIETRYGVYRISARIGIAAGTVQWGIVGPSGGKTYYVAGSAVDRAVAAQEESTNGGVVVGGELAEALRARGIETESGTEGRIFLSEIRAAAAASPPKAPRLAESSLLEMFPREVVEWSGLGEFRRVSVVFVGLRTVPEHQELDRITSAIRTACAQLGGYFNLLDYGDKGMLILVLFGAPVGHEDDPERAVEFALAVIEELGEGVRCAMTSGVVYAGLVGSELRSTYTALGSTVNLSARLMQKTPWGTLFVPEQAGELLGERYRLEENGALVLKGIDRPVTACTVKRTGGSGRGGFSGMLVGRADELERLRKSIAGALAERAGGITYLYGEAGMGKSRLTHEASNLLPPHVRLFALESDPVLRKSLNPFVGVLNEYFTLPEASHNRAALFDEGFRRLLAAVRGGGRLDDREKAASALERYRPFLGVLVGVHDEGTIYDQLDPQSRFENTMYAIGEFFLAHCLMSPIVILVEDLHALDEDSRRVFQYLTRNLSGQPARVVATSRYTDDGGRPAIHSPEVTSVEEIRVGPLSREDIGLLLERRIGGSVAPRTLDLVYEKTQGNPYYAEQFSGYLMDTGRLRLEKEEYVLTGALQEIPTGINGILVARLDRLSPPLKALTQVASVFGRQFPASTVGRVMSSPAVGSSMNSGEVESCLDLGTKQRLWEASGDDMFAFQSTLLRDTAYEMQSSQRVRSLHSIAAYALEDELSEDETRSADLAHHFDHGEVHGRSAYYLRRAAEVAAGSYKNDEAIELYTRLLSVVDPHEQIEVRLRMAEVDDLRGDWQSAIRSLEEAREAARILVRSKVEAVVLVKAGEILQKQGDYAKAEAVLRTAVELARRLDDRPCYGRALLFLGRTYWSTGKYDQGSKLLETATRVFEAIGAENDAALSLYYTGVIHRDKNEYARAHEFYKRAEELFHHAGNRRLETYPLYDLAVIYLYRGELESAFSSFAQVEAVYREMGYKSGLAAALGNLGVISAFQGKFDRAEAYGDEALAIVQEIGEQLAVAYATFNNGLFSYLRGSHAAAASTFEGALELMRKIGAEGYYGYVQSYLACSLAYLDRFGESLRHSRDHLKRISSSGSDVENGRTHLAVALVLSRLKAPLGGKDAEVLAEIGNASGLEATAAAYFEASVERATKASYIATLFSAYAQYGAYLLRSGDASAAVRGRELLLKARELAERTTMVYELPRIQALLA